MKDREKYKLLTYCSAMFPLNRFYLGEKVTLLRLITINYIFCGWISDLLYMDKRFDEAMAKRGFTNTNIRNEQAK